MKGFVWIVLLSSVVTMLWQQHITLKMDEHPQADLSSTTTFQRSSVPFKASKRNASAFQLPENDTHIAYHTCHLLKESITIPKIPHFLIVGAQKAGTTALMEFLKQHPDIQTSQGKEPHFFDWHYPTPRLRTKWLTERGLPLNLPPDETTCAVQKAYLEYFNTTAIGRRTIVFEKTPGYLFLNDVPERISTTLFWKPKIVVILRNPVDRAISNYRMKIQTHGRSFEDIVDEEMRSLIALGLSRAPMRNDTLAAWDDASFRIPNISPRVSEELHWKHYRTVHHCNYIQKGMYAHQLVHWLRYFPIDKENPSRSSLLVLHYEEFRNFPERVFSRLLNFLGATPFVPVDGFTSMHNYHPERKDQMIPATRQYLTRFFRPYNILLAELLGDEWVGVWDERGTT